jgi:hypothetical protein
MLRSKALKFLFVLIALNTSYSQNNEIGLIFGGTNYIGDVGPTTYINPFLKTRINKENYTDSLRSFSPFIGIIYKKNLNERISLRLGFTLAEIKSSDLWRGSSYDRQERGKWFKNKIEEFKIAAEFNFVDFDISAQDFQFSPYVSTGFSYFRFDNLYYPLNQNNAVSYGKSNDFAIPITVGLKLKPLKKFVLSFEISAHHSFTENLDGSYPRFDESTLYSQGSFGGNLSQDWYVFTGISLTYIFGNYECYCP